jgi:hypothetical protein
VVKVRVKRNGQYFGGRGNFGKRSLRRPRRIWKDNIKMDLREVE